MTTIYVGNLPTDYTKSDLGKLLKRYGRVDRASVMSGKGFGFVDMPDANQAAMAIETLNDAEVDGKRLKVQEARNQSTPRRTQFGRPVVIDGTR